jgi:hypothetical protein
VRDSRGAVELFRTNREFLAHLAKTEIKTEIPGKPTP